MMQPPVRRIRFVSVLLFTLTLGHAAAGRAAAGSFTVEQAVELALRSNPRLAAARARVDATGERAASGSRRMLPAVRVSDELQYYNDKFAIPFPPPQETVVRDQRTNTFVASIEEPLLGLLRLNSEKEAQAAGTVAAQAQLATAEADVRQAVETQFLRYFESQAVEQIAEASAREIGAEVEVARARLNSGVITRADLLRLEVAVANAHQQALQARSQAEMARASLLALMGLGAEGAGVTLLEPTNLLAAARTPSPRLDALLPTARARRPEMSERLHLIDVADRQARASTYALLPDLNAEAAYLRVDGQAFAPKNSAYVGLKAQWAIWEWGATDHLRLAAAAEAGAARRDLEWTERQIEADLSMNLALGDAARGAVVAAEEAITSAEEAFRVTQAQVKAGAATTTDLLESESALTQARLNLTRAQYELALAHVGLAHATGS